VSSALTIAGVHFPSANHALRYAREVAGRYRLGETLGRDDALFAFDLGDPNVDLLFAGGVNDIGVRHAHDRLIRVFELRMRDGAARTLDPAGCLRKPPDLSAVLPRAGMAVLPQLERFKQDRFRGGRLAPCDRTGHLIDRDHACVVHHGRATPLSLLARFCAERGFSPQRIDRDPLVPTWVELEEGWREFHREQAQLELVIAEPLQAAA
jgi:hypothetical protein